jgi:RNA polymerase sigma-70 factor (ECF subfamily)
MPNQEAEWLDGARRFEEKTLAAIYDAHSPELYRYAFRLLGHHQAAEDLVAATFHRFLRALHSGGGPKEHLRAYLYRVAHNLAMDAYRRKPVEAVPLDEIETSPSAENDLEGDVEKRIAQEKARAAIWFLTDDQRQVIVLKYLQGLSNQEVADSLGKPVGAVKSLQHRALNALRRILQANEGRSEAEG